MCLAWQVYTCITYQAKMFGLKTCIYVLKESMISLSNIMGIILRWKEFNDLLEIAILKITPECPEGWFFRFGCPNEGHTLCLLRLSIPADKVMMLRYHNDKYPRWGVLIFHSVDLLTPGSPLVASLSTSDGTIHSNLSRLIRRKASFPAAICWSAVESAGRW